MKSTETQAADAARPRSDRDDVERDVPGLLGMRARRRMTAWWSAKPSSPLVLTDVLPQESAARLLAVLKSHEAWQYEHVVLNEDDWPEEVDDDAFTATPRERRFSRNDRLPLEEIEGIAETDELQRIMGCEPVLQHLSEVTGQRVVGPIMEFARYRKGDFLTEHKDAFNARVIGLVLYLADTAWNESFGGCLGYRNEIGETTITRPTFNTMSVFPFRTDCAHWVSQVVAPDVTRYSVALHYTAADA